MKKHLKKKTKSKKKATGEKTKIKLQKIKKTTLATVKKVHVLELLLTFQTRITRKTLDSRHQSLIIK